MVRDRGADLAAGALIVIAAGGLFAYAVWHLAMLILYLADQLAGLIA